MEQLKFPDDYDLLSSIEDIDGLDCIYFLTIKSKFPTRYHRIEEWVKNIKNKSVIWDGKLVDDLTEEDKAFTDLIYPGFSMPDVNSLARFQAINISHIEILRDARKNNYQMILILEDDVMLSRDCSKRLSEQVNILSKLNHPFVAYLGDALVGPVWHDTRIFWGNGLYVKEDKYSRCADSYLINLLAINKLLERFDNPNEKIHIPIDHYLSFCSQKNNFLVLYAEPTYATQTSMRNFHI